MMNRIVRPLALLALAFATACGRPAPAPTGAPQAAPSQMASRLAPAAAGSSLAGQAAQTPTQANPPTQPPAASATHWPAAQPTPAPAPARQAIGLRTYQSLQEIWRAEYGTWELVSAVAFSPDNKLLAVAAGQWVHVYETGEFRQVQLLALEDWAGGLDFAPQRVGLLAVAERSGVVRIFDTQLGRQVCAIDAHPKGGVNRAVWSPDGLLLATAGNEPIVRLWDVSSLAADQCQVSMQGELIGAAIAVPDLAFSPDGSLIATADGLAVRLRDPVSLRLVSTLRGASPVCRLAFHPGSGQIITAHDALNFFVWEISSGNLLFGHDSSQAAQPIKKAFPWQVAFTADGSLAAAGLSSGQIIFWIPEQPGTLAASEAWPVHEGPISALAFSADGLWLATGGLDRTVRLWAAAASGR